MKECPRCLLTDDIAGVIIGEKQCNYCDIHDSLEKQYPVSEEAFDHDCEIIKKRGSSGKYDCLLGVSGGFDSSYLAYKLFARGVRVLLLHYDNGFDTAEAKHNIDAIVHKTKFDFINFCVGQKEFKEVSKSFLFATVHDCDIPNDMAMAKVFIDIATQFKIPSVINGHNFRTEGSCPIGWTYMDGRYVRSVYGKSITRLPVLGAFDQIVMAWKGIKHFRLLYHCDVNKDWEKRQLGCWCGWRDYGGHHCENIYTEFVGWYIYNAFGIHKGIVEQSAFIRSGLTTKEKAKAVITPIELSELKLEHVLSEIDMSHNELTDCMNRTPWKDYRDFKTYKTLFKRLKPLVWLAVKADLLPRTFYEKYTKDVVWPKR